MPDHMTQLGREQNTRARHRQPSHGEPPKSLRECVRHAIDAYFSHLDGHPTSEIYRMVLDEVEPPLLEAVLHRTRGNYSHAAELLGINRATLRKKLKQHRIDCREIKEAPQSGP